MCLNRAGRFGGCLRGGFRPCSPQLYPFGEDFHIGLLQPAGRWHFERTVIANRTDQKAVVGLARNNCRSGIAAFQNTCAIRETEVAECGLCLRSMAPIAVTNENGTNLCFEICFGVRRGLRGRYSAHNQSTRQQESIKRRHGLSRSVQASLESASRPSPFPGPSALHPNPDTCTRDA